MNQLSLRYAIGATLFFFILNTPSASRAEDFSFAPRVLSTRGDLELDMTSQTNEKKQDGAESRTTSLFFREKVNLGADGYVYHPRFLLFRTRVSEGLNQGSVYGTGDTSRSSGASTEYELRTLFLPQHPYNLSLFALHREASAPGTFLRGQTASRDERGAAFSFRRRPFSFHTSYNVGSTDTGANRTDTKSFRVNGGLRGTAMSNSAAYSHAEARTAFGSRAVREGFSYVNNARAANLALDSRVNYSTTDQTKPESPDFDTSTFSWTEQLTAPLPWSFSSGASFGYQNVINRTGEDPSGPAREEFNRSTSASLHLSHRLYQSLATNYTANQARATSSLGEVTVRSDSLASTYTKALPDSRLTAGVHVNRSNADRRGTPAVLNEPHAAALFGSFFLAQQNVLEDTIVIQVKDPETGGFVTLPKSGYLVSLRGGSLQITIESVAPVELQADPAYVYDFLASYSLLNESRIASRSEGFSVKLDLLDNLLSPYYSFSSSGQEVLSGTLAGGPDRTTSETAGVSCRAGPYSGSIERQTFRSRLNPSKTRRTTAEYREPLGKDASLSAVFSYAQTDYLPTSLPQASEGVREKRTGTSVSLNRNVPASNLNLSASGSFSRSNAVIDTDTLSLNGYMSWRIGLLTVSSGAQLSRSESSIETRRTTLVSQYYYVKVSRRMF